MTAAIFLSLTLALQYPLPAAGFLTPYHITSPISSNRHDLTHQSPKYTSKRTKCLSATLQYLDDSNMIDLLFRPNGDQPRSVLVDACAVWCGPCKLIEPFLFRLGKSIASPAVLGTCTHIGGVLTFIST